MIVGGYFCYAVINGMLTSWKYQVNGEMQTREGQKYYARLEKAKFPITTQEFEETDLRDLEKKFPPPEEFKDFPLLRNQSIRGPVEGIRRGMLTPFEKRLQLERMGMKHDEIEKIIVAIYPEEQSEESDRASGRGSDTLPG